MNPSNFPLLKTRLNFLKVSEIYREPIPPKFLLVIQEFLDHYEATGKADWDLLMLAVKSFHSRCVGKNTDPFYAFIFDALEELKCREDFTLRYCLRLYFLDRLMGYGFKSFFTGSAHLDRSEPQRIRIPLHDSVINFDPMVIDLNPFFLHDNQVYLRFLRYGLNINVTKIHNLDCYTNILRTAMTNREIMWFHRGHHRYDKIHTMMRLICNVPSIESCPRRLALAMLTIDSLMQFQFFESNESINSLQLFFRTIKDPYLTLYEMARILWTLSRSFHERDKNYFIIMDESYRKFFPEAAKFLQPRSLKHLCRVQVRQCMIEANSMHFGVPDLRIPKTLENYLLLEE